MTKLEQKLVDLGYYRNKNIKTKYHKDFKSDPFIYITIELNINSTEILDYWVRNDNNFRISYDFNITKELFNEMESDVEILKEVEENE